MLDPGKRLYLARYGKGTKGDGWYSFDDHGVHFIGLSNVTHSGPDGQWLLGPDQIAWMTDDLRGVSASTPIVVFAHVPLWTVYAKWGWGTGDASAAMPCCAASAGALFAAENEASTANLVDAALSAAAPTNTSALRPFW